MYTQRNCTKCGAKMNAVTYGWVCPFCGYSEPVRTELYTVTTTTTTSASTTKNCLECGHVNSWRAKFCEECGTKFFR